MDVRSVKAGLFEVPVVVIRRDSPFLQLKLSWSSTVKVAVQDKKQNVLPEFMEKKVEDSVGQASEICLCAGILPPPQLSKDENYAKSLIDQNKGIVEVGASWPACQRQALRLTIVWHDIKTLLEVDRKSRAYNRNAAKLTFVILIGARFVEAFILYQQRRQLLMSLSMLPFHEQQVAHEIKLLLVQIMKSLQNHQQFTLNHTDGDVEESVLFSIINILVDMQLSDDKKLPLLSGDGDLGVTCDYLRILKHKVLSELILLLQNVLVLKSPSKESVDFTKLDEREAWAKKRVFGMRRAVLDVIELLKHNSRAGGLCTKTHPEGESTTSLNFMEKHGERKQVNKCIQSQMAQIHWDWLLAVLGKNDPVSLENILCSIQDEDKRRLLKVMAWPLDLVQCEDDEKLDKELMEKIDFVVRGNLGGHTSGAAEVTNGSSCGSLVRSIDELSGESPFQEIEWEQHLQSDEGDGHASSVAVKTDCVCSQTPCANEGGGQHTFKSSEQDVGGSHIRRQKAREQLGCQEHTLQKHFCANDGRGQPTAEDFEQHVEESQVQGQEARKHSVQAHTKESRIEGQGAGGQSECEEHVPTDIQGHKTGTDLDMCMDPSHASVMHDDGDAAVESPSWTHRLHDNTRSDPMQALGGLPITNKAASKTLADLHVPVDSCSYAASCSQPTASSDNGGDGDFQDDIEVSKARRRKRRNRRMQQVKENQNLPCSSQSHLRKSRSSGRKFWLFMMMAFIFGTTVFGVLWFQSDFSSNAKMRERRSFAKGYLP
ncbi:hypothetical protein L7F22_045298 [Adiantum nelumboides]|nr:hypothetical protein [Adiantum nelumboides]